MSAKTVPSTPDCISDDRLERYHGMELGDAAADVVRLHLERCAACAARSAALLDRHEGLIRRIRSWDLPALDAILSDSRSPSPRRRASSALSRPIEDVPLPTGIIPGYEILREIHRGGQGVVYQATQRSTKRLVAIKVLLEGPYASAAARRRFEREIELIANLKHPNIVAVFDSGTTSDARQYCVMDFVEGQRLDQYARQQRLDLADLLRLFALICDAVNFAHQRGVIHRDLKPSNILVDAEGRPRVLDFGLAKEIAAPDDPLVSISGQVVGTLPYLSPELARGGSEQVDVRTDVYALGVIFYELLTGQYPYPVVGQIADVLKHIVETIPKRPSQIWRAETGVPAREGGPCPLDDEVETIALKALAKEPERRYQSAGELARDIARYQADEPIEAKRDSGWYLLRKTLRKKRGAVLVGTSFVLLLAAWGVTSFFLWRVQKEQNVQIAAEAENTRRQRDRAVDAEARARRRYDQVRELAHAFIFDFHDAIVDLAGATPARELIVKKGLAYLDSLSKESGGERPFMREMALAYAKMGDVQGSVRQPNLGDRAGAMASYRKALELLTTLSKQDPNDHPILANLATAHSRVGDIFWVNGKLEDSLAKYREAHDISKKLVELEPDNAEFRVGLSVRCQDIGDVLFQVGRPHDAITEYTRAGEQIAEIMRLKPGSAEASYDLSLNHEKIGDVLFQIGKSAEALSHYHDARDIRDKLSAANPANSRYKTGLASSHDQIGNVLTRMNRSDEALAEFRAALQIRKDLADADPSNVAARRLLSGSYDQIATMDVQRGDLDHALAHLTAALELRKALARANPADARAQDDMAISYNHLGDLYVRVGKLDDAEKALRQGIALRRAAVDKKSTDAWARDGLAISYSLLGDVLAKKSEVTEAREAYDQALALRRELCAQDPASAEAARGLAVVEDRVAKYLSEAGEVADALQHARSAVEIGKRLAEQNPGDHDSRRVYAVAFYRVGTVHEMSARMSGKSRDERLTEWTAAAKSYGQSVEALDAMRRDKLLANADTAAVEEITALDKTAQQELEKVRREPTSAPSATD